MRLAPNLSTIFNEISPPISGQLIFSKTFLNISATLPPFTINFFNISKFLSELYPNDNICVCPLKQVLSTISKLL